MADLRLSRSAVVQAMRRLTLGTNARKGARCVAVAPVRLLARYRTTVSAQTVHLVRVQADYLAIDDVQDELPGPASSEKLSDSLPERLGNRGAIRHQNWLR
jgi:hypothetical protein